VVLLLFYNAADPTLSTVLVGSPWGGTWKRFTAGSGIDYVTGQSVWSPGTSGRIVTLPPGTNNPYYCINRVIVVIVVVVALRTPWLAGDK
jgi:hypothetical protein